MKYLHWKEEKINDFSDDFITSMYEKGFVFTRLDKGVMHQTRSVRIDLKKFELTSENRRILRKDENISIDRLPIPYQTYSWEIGKLAKDFYDIKAPDSFSVNKIKEIITTPHNFNIFLKFSDVGYAICYENKSMLHYCYPCYDLQKASKDMGLIMMTKAIFEAKSRGLSYVYLGSLQRPGDVYKLQFEGIEWFDGKEWRKDIEKVEVLLRELN